MDGRKITFVIAIILGVVAFQFSTREKEIDTTAPEVIKAYMASHYGRLNLPAMRDLSKANNVRADRLKDMFERGGTEGIEIVSLRARSRKESVVVRAEIEIGGETPPDGRRIHYFLLKQSRLDGWVVQREVWAWRYWITS